MATPLDIGLVEMFQIIFPFLFILTVTFAFLTQIKPFKENYVYAAIMATSLAVLTLFFPFVIKVINVMAPWFVLLFVIIVFALMGYYILGYSEDELKKEVTTGEMAGALGWWMFALVLIIAIGSIAVVFSAEKGFTTLTADDASDVVTSGDGEQAGFFQTLLHPKILGMAVILLVAFFAIRAVGAAPE